MKTFLFALDLTDDPAMIAEYEAYHRPEGVWPEVVEQILQPGVVSQQLYRLGTRLVLALNTTDDFDLEAKRRSDAANPRMREWEMLMDPYQQRLPEAKENEKWVLMEKIFDVKA